MAGFDTLHGRRGMGHQVTTEEVMLTRGAPPQG